MKLKHDCFTIAALLYSAFGVAIEKARGAEDDINTVAAGTLTGMVFKSAGGSLLYLYLPVKSKPSYVFDLLKLNTYFLEYYSANMYLLIICAVSG